MLSDGAGAAYLCDAPNPRGISLKIRWIELVSYANEMPVCMYAGGEVRDGRFVGWKEVGCPRTRALQHDGGQARM